VGFANAAIGGVALRLFTDLAAVLLGTALGLYLGTRIRNTFWSVAVTSLLAPILIVALQVPTWLTYGNSNMRWPYDVWGGEVLCVTVGVVSGAICLTVAAVLFRAVIRRFERLEG
jgi:hypothetical protein